MPPRRMTQANIKRLIADAITQDRATRGTTGEASRSGGNNSNQGRAPPVHECTYSNFMKCNPTTFKGVEGAVELCLCRSERKKKVEAYIHGLPEIIREETTSPRPIVLNEAVKMAHTLMEQKLVAKAKRIAESNKQKWENNNQGNNHINNNNRGNYRNNNRHNQNNNQRQSNAQEWRSKNVASGATVRPNVVCYGCGERGHKNYPCSKRTNQKGRHVESQAYVIRDVEHNQCPKVVTGTFLLNNHYATFDSGVDKIFVDKFSHLIYIKPIKLNTSYEVELADGKVVSTNSVLSGCTLNLLNHLFDIDLMPIELGTFDVIVGMDWLVERDALIVCGKKEVHVPYKNKTLVVKSDSSISQLKVISVLNQENT
nr:hypothetical protein [Tanacetum cinerariifolium]